MTLHFTSLKKRWNKWLDQLIFKSKYLACFYPIIYTSLLYGFFDCASSFPSISTSINYSTQFKSSTKCITFINAISLCNVFSWLFSSHTRRWILSIQPQTSTLLKTPPSPPISWLPLQKCANRAKIPLMP